MPQVQPTWCSRVITRHHELFLFTITFIDLKFLVWNCQGVGDYAFKGVLNDFCQIYSFSILILVEPRISGITMDKEISSLKFERSHKVEASRFSRGI